MGVKYPNAGCFRLNRVGLSGSVTGQDLANGTCWPEAARGISPGSFRDELFSYADSVRWKVLIFMS